MALLDEHIHRLSLEDYLSIVEAARRKGNFGWDRTELIEGVVYDVSPESALHARAQKSVFLALLSAFPGREVMSSGSVRLADESLWAPDVYVVRPTDLDRAYPLGSELVLVVEVSISTLHHDLGSKYRAYARNGIAEYWVLVPQPGGYLLRHAEPDPDHGRYGSMTRIELAGGFADLDVAALLAG